MKTAAITAMTALAGFAIGYAMRDSDGSGVWFTGFSLCLVAAVAGMSFDKDV